MVTVCAAVDTTFTRRNVQRAVKEVKDADVLGRCLGVPSTRRQEIQRQFSSVPQQVKAYIDYFMDHDPLASWRSVIVALDAMEEKEAADKIRRLAEPITGRVRGSGSRKQTQIIHIQWNLSKPDITGTE